MDQLEDDEVLQQGEHVFAVGTPKSGQLKYVDVVIRDMQMGEERKFTMDQDYRLWGNG